MFLGVAHKTFLSAIGGADADDDQAFVGIFLQQGVVVGNGSHARAAPRRIKIQDDDFAFHAGGRDAAIDPIGDAQRQHGFAFQGGVVGAVFRFVVPGPVVGKFAGENCERAKKN